MGGLYNSNGVITNTVQYAQMLPGGGTTPWSITNPLAVIAGDQSCVTSGGYIYCMGGGHDGTTNTVQYAQMLPGGGTAPWVLQPGSNSLKIPESMFSCTTANSIIYCMGGSYAGGFDNTVQYAQTLSSGGTTSWTVTNPLKYGDYSHSCVTASGYVYCMGGMNGDNRVQYASLNPTACYPLALPGLGGTATANKTNSAGCPAGYYAAGTTLRLTATPYPGYNFYNWTGTYSSSSDLWTTFMMPASAVSETASFVFSPPSTTQWVSQSNKLATGLYGTGCVAANNYIYCMGGSWNSVTNPSNTVQYASISGGAPTSAWTSQTANKLAVAEVASSCVTANNYLYCMGGSSGNYYGMGLASNAVQYASISSGATTSAWTSQTTNTLYQANFGMGCVTSGGYIYCMGGGHEDSPAGGEAVPTVQYAKILSSGVTSSWSIESNGLATAESYGPQGCVVTTNNYIYCMENTNGGGQTPDTSAVQYAKILSPGLVSQWTTTNALYLGAVSYGCATANNYLYCLGGIYNSNGLIASAIQYAQILPGGGTSIWISQTANTLNVPEFLPSCVTVSSTIYCMGGGGSNTVVQYANVLSSLSTNTASVSSLNPSTYGASVTFTATASPLVPNGETVTFYDGATQIGTGTTASGGIATFTTNSLAVGTHSITASYPGDLSLLSSTSGPVSQTVNKASTTTGLSSSLNPSTYGNTTTFAATVSPAVPNGETVTFYDGSNTIGTANTLGSIVTFSTNALSVGTHSITSTYPGDANFAASNSMVLSQTVNKVPTSTSLTSNANPSIHGNSIMFNATISPAVPNGEAVTFYDGSNTIGTANTANNVATFTTNALAVGLHSIAATYSGDANFLTSSSAVVSQIVNKVPTSTSLTSNANPLTYGNSILLTATVSPAAPNGETVTFYDGSNTIGNGITSGGIATLATASLAVGTHPITATYVGDINFATSTSNAVSQVVNQVPTSTSLTSNSYNPSIGLYPAYGNSTTFTATISPAVPNGEAVTFYDGSNTIGTANTLGSVAIFSTNALSVGTHLINATYSGDVNFAASNSVVFLGVVKASTTTNLSSNLNPSTYGNSIIFIATVSPAVPNGETVTFYDGSNTIGTANTLGSVAIFSTNALSVGTHLINATYPGDSNFVISYNIISQEVNPIPTSTSLTSNSNPSTYSNSITFTATVSPAVPNGETVTFYDGSNTIGTANTATTNAVGGIATFSTNALAIGTHAITATYIGDAIFVTSTSGAISQVINKVPTATSLTSNSNPSTYGNSTTFTATVSPAVPNGEAVTFYDGSNTIGTANTVGSIATFTTNAFSAGSHSIAAAYPGDSIFTTSTSGVVSQTVKQATATTSLTSNSNPSTYGNSTTFTATISPAVPNGEAVTFYDGSNTIGTANTLGGVAIFSTNALSVGTHLINATSEDANFIISYNAVSQTVNKAPTTTSLTSNSNPSTYGNSTTFTATISPAVPNGEAVTFYDGSNTIGTANTLGGVAIFSTNALSVGTHPITATYSGDVNFILSSNGVSQTVNKAPTTTSLTSNSNPSTYGNSITFTATVSSAVPNGEAVTFYDGSNTIGTANTAGSTATFSTNALAIGTHPITATYAGDATSATSTSNTVSQVVSKDLTSTVLISSLNPSTYGNTILFTATVSPTVPNGETVTFYEGLTSVGTGATSGSSAILLINTLSAGVHSITATYAGDTNFGTSTSNAVSQVVNKAPTTTSLTSSLNPSINGTSITLTATVSPSVPNGKAVRFYDGSNVIGTGTTSGSAATFSTNALSVGTHSITATYAGDTNFGTSTSNVVLQRVLSKTSTSTSLTSSLNPSTYGASVTFTAMVSPIVPSGETVAFYDGSNTIGTGTTSGSGIATLTMTSLSAGTHLITASYLGDSRYAGSTSNMVSQTVNTITTTMLLTSSQNPSSYSNSITFTATLSPSAPNGETVTFYDGSNAIGARTISGSVATFTTNTFAIGTHSITATYAGDANFVGSTSSAVSQVVTPALTTTTLTSYTNPSTYNALVALTATISPAVPNGETVTFYDGLASIGTGTTSGSVATFATNALSVGTHSLTATYLGDSNFETSTSSTVSQVVSSTGTGVVMVSLTSNSNPSTYGTSVIFNASIYPSVTDGETVTFYDGSIPIGTGTTTGSNAMLTTNVLTAGTHSITAEYSGDATYAVNTSSAVSQVVNPATMTVSLTSNSNPSTYGTSVTFTATMSPSVPNGENITFYDGSTQISTGTTSGSVATFTTNALSAGTHSIDAVYPGDANFEADTSPTVMQAINKVSTSTSLTSSLNPSAYDASVTFTATISPTVPNGETVNFYDWSNAIGTGTTSGSVATLAISSLLSGTHSITASYPGDPGFALSTSASISQQVTNSVPVISITPSSSSINIGQSVLYTANIPAGAGIGPFTANLIHNGNVIGTNTISDTSGNSVTFSYTPTALGSLTFNAMAIDNGAVPTYFFNSIDSTITVNPLLTNSVSNVVVSVPANTPTNLDYTSANTILSITSSNSINATVLISNVTSSYTSTPSTSVSTKLVVLNFSVTNSTPSVVSYSLTVSIPCGSNAAPYKLIGGTWTALPFSSNPAACTITFNVPADPVIGLFSSGSSSTGGGSTGGGGSVTSGSGGSGGGGAIGPSLTRFSQNTTTCYQISNFTSPDSELFSLNGTTFSVIASAIMSSSAALIINGNTYILSLNSHFVNLVGTNNDFNYTAYLAGVSYLPILHTVTVDVCSIPASATKPAPSHVNVTNASTTTTIPVNTTSTVPTSTTIANATVTTTVPTSKTTTATPSIFPVAVGVAIAIAMGLTYYRSRRKRR